MSSEPQYTFDKLGNPIGVFLPIDEWNKLSEEMHLDIPQRQKDLIDTRLAEYHKNPGNVLDWDDVSKELEKEDGAL
jgi:putative addiction module component (TIGR02574 family)